MDTPGVPPALAGDWQRAFEALARRCEAGAPARGGQSWSVGLDGSAASVPEVLALLPGHYTRVCEELEELVDCSGAGVGYETERAVYACDAERAMFVYTEHWQAGLFASVTVFDDEMSYRESLDRTERRFAEDDGDEAGWEP